MNNNNQGRPHHQAKRRGRPKKTTRTAAKRGRPQRRTSARTGVRCTYVRYICVGWTSAEPHPNGRVGAQGGEHNRTTTTARTTAAGGGTLFSKCSAGCVWRPDGIPQSLGIESGSSGDGYGKAPRRGRENRQSPRRGRKSANCTKTKFCSLQTPVICHFSTKKKKKWKDS